MQEVRRNTFVFLLIRKLSYYTKLKLFAKVLMRKIDNILRYVLRLYNYTDSFLYILHLSKLMSIMERFDDLM